MGKKKKKKSVCLIWSKGGWSSFFSLLRQNFQFSTLNGDWDWGLKIESTTKAWYDCLHHFIVVCRESAESHIVNRLGRIVSRSIFVSVVGNLDLWKDGTSLCELIPQSWQVCNSIWRESFTFWDLIDGNVSRDMFQFPQRHHNWMSIFSLTSFAGKFHYFRKRDRFCITSYFL